MESVISKIREGRKVENHKKKDNHIREAIVDGFHVKMRFDPAGNSNVLATIRSMLYSAQLDAALAPCPRGECA